MKNTHEAVHRKIGIRSYLFWLLFAMAACGWIVVPGYLYAEDWNAILSDTNACSAALNSATQPADIDGAIARITAIIQRGTRANGCYQFRSALYLKKGDLNQAILDANKMIELPDPTGVGGYKWRAVLYFKAGRWDQALADCDIVLGKDKKNADCLVLREHALYRLNRYADALAASDEVLKPQIKLDQGMRANMYLFRGASQFYLNRYAEAIDSLSQALTLGSTDRGAFNMRGIAEWKLGQFEKAKVDAAALVQTDPRLQLRFSGDHLLDLFDLDRRRAATTNAVQAAEAAEAKGDWLTAFQSWDAAYSYCSSYMLDGPTINSKVLDGLYRSYPKLAVKPALPEHARQYQVQAETFFQEKNFAKAIEAYGNEINVAPWFAQAYFNRGFLEGEQQQQYTAAIADMQIYLKLVPDAQDARAAQDQIYAWQAKAK